MSGPQQYPPQGGQPGYGQPTPGGQPSYGAPPDQPANQAQAGWQGNQYASAPPPPASTYQSAGQTPYYGPTPTGPLGQPRSIGVCILLAIVTLGIYPFVWVYKTHSEIKNHCGKGVGGGIGLLLYFLAGIATFFMVPYEVEAMLQSAGRPSRVSAVTGFWVLLPLVGSLVWFVKVQGQLNEYWRSLGAQG